MLTTLATSSLPVDQFRADLHAVCGSFQVQPAASRSFMRGAVAYEARGGFEFAHVAKDAQSIRRDRSDIARDGAEHFFLIVQEEGRALMSQRDSVSMLRPGDLVLIDSAEPSEFTFLAATAGSCPFICRVQSCKKGLATRCAAACSCRAPTTPRWPSLQCLPKPFSPATTPRSRATWARPCTACWAPCFCQWHAVPLHRCRRGQCPLAGARGGLHRCPPHRLRPNHSAGGAGSEDLKPPIAKGIHAAGHHAHRIPAAKAPGHRLPGLEAQTQCGRQDAHLDHRLHGGLQRSVVLQPPFSLNVQLHPGQYHGAGSCQKLG